MHKMPDGKMMKNSDMKMASGGMPMVMKDGKKIPAFAADGEGKMKHGGSIKKMNMGGMSYAKGGGIEAKGKTKGAMVKMTKRFAEGGMTDADQEAADKAAGLEESNKEAPVGFFERLRMGNIDDSSSEAYKRFGAGRGATSRASRVPVEDAVPVKVDRSVPAKQAMGEDERPAPTGMAAATVAAKPVVSTKPVVKTPVTTAAKPVMAAKSAAPSKPAAPVVDELAEYAAAKKKPPTTTKSEDFSAAEKRMFTPPSKEEIDKGMEVASQMLGVGASLSALRALAKKLAESGKLGKFGKMGKGVKELGLSQKQLGNTPARSEAPYLKEIGNSPTKIGTEPLKLGMKKGGNVKKMAHGGSVKTSAHASKRGDGIATKGKTRGKMV
jgi:hypothetical protein